MATNKQRNEARETRREETVGQVHPSQLLRMQFEKDIGMISSDDWMKSTVKAISVEEDPEEMKQLDEALKKMNVDASSTTASATGTSQPQTEFGICVIASDNTASLEIVLMDRPIRTILAKRVYQLEEEYDKKYPTILKTLQGGDYTMKLMISKENTENKEELFLATDIFCGFKFEEPSVDEETLIKPTEQSMGDV
ncbi:hypothetical protein POM88_000730 [Heracleum sosnowskyi]|uniref:Uncharacterized protein n=1 Tax=Heracleum sosnowskyi TaxID=360622 RepID=A0AAD8JET9_9APIA|nr:hypothetical protein POM88_000730 [Heracleum sosnowskyi]